MPEENVVGLFVAQVTCGPGYANRHFHKMPLKTNRIKFKVTVCGDYLGYDRSNEGPLVFLPCYFVSITLHASLICICKTIIIL